MARHHKSEEGTAERIIEAATKLFAARGYDGTSIKQISDVARVNIAAVNYHFESKEKLFLRILESFGDMRLQSAQKILGKASSEKEFRVRLEMFVEQFLDSLLQHPDLFRMVQREIEQLHHWVDDLFRGTFVEILETLARYLEAGKRQSFIAKSIDPRLAARLLFNQLINQVRIDHVSKRYFSFSLRNDSQRKLWIHQTLQIFLHGITSDVR